MIANIVLALVTAVAIPLDVGAYFAPSPPPRRTRIWGWTDMGYTAATSSPGRLAVAPEMNHFGQEYLLNQLALTAEGSIDPNGTRTGHATSYVALTPGLVAHITPQLLLRLELRADFAGKPVFGNVHSPTRNRSQFTPAIECVYAF